MAGQTWTQVLHLLVKGPQSLFAHSCEMRVLPHSRDSINASFSGLRDIRHLINAGFLCPLLRSSGLHQDTIPGSGPVVQLWWLVLMKATASTYFWGRSVQAVVMLLLVTITCFGFG